MKFSEILIPLLVLFTASNIVVTSPNDSDGSNQDLSKSFARNVRTIPHVSHRSNGRASGAEVNVHSKRFLGFFGALMNKVAIAAVGALFMYPVQYAGYLADAYCNGDFISCLVDGIEVCMDYFNNWDQYIEKRDSKLIYNLEYPPLPGVSARERLRTEVPEGDFHYIGNVTNTNTGNVHSLHYRRNGTLQSLRSIGHGHPSSDSSGSANITKRQDSLTNQEEGAVITYHYGTNVNYAEEQTFSDDFGTSSAVSFMESFDIGNDCMSDYNTLVCCASQVAPDTYTTAVGFIDVGWNYDAYQWSSDQAILDQLNSCWDWQEEAGPPPTSE